MNDLLALSDHALFEAHSGRVVHYRRHLVEICGGVMGALIFSRAVYLQLIVGPGRWWYHSIPQWHADLGVTRKVLARVRRSLGPATESFPAGKGLLLSRRAVLSGTVLQVNEYLVPADPFRLALSERTQPPAIPLDWSRNPNDFPKRPIGTPSGPLGETNPTEVQQLSQTAQRDPTPSQRDPLPSRWAAHPVPTGHLYLHKKVLESSSKEGKEPPLLNPADSGEDPLTELTVESGLVDSDRTRDRTGSSEPRDATIPGSDVRPRTEGGEVALGVPARGEGGVPSPGTGLVSEHERLLQIRLLEKASRGEEVENPLAYRQVILGLSSAEVEQALGVEHQRQERRSAALSRAAEAKAASADVRQAERDHRAEVALESEREGLLLSEFGDLPAVERESLIAAAAVLVGDAGKFREAKERAALLEILEARAAKGGSS